MERFASEKFCNMQVEYCMQSVLKVRRQTLQMQSNTKYYMNVLKLLFGYFWFGSAKCISTCFVNDMNSYEFNIIVHFLYMN